MPNVPAHTSCSWFLAGLLLWVATAQAALGRPPATQPSQDVYQRGLAALEAGNPILARGLLTDAVQAAPGDAERVLALAEACFALGVTTPAEEHLRTLISRDAEQLAWQVALARCDALHQRWRAAANRLGPHEARLSPPARSELLGSLALLGNEQAEQRLHRLVENCPTEAGPWLAWIDVALAREQPACALHRIAAAPPDLQALPAAHWRTAQARFVLGQALGKTVVRHVPNGHGGQFVRGALLIEDRGDGRFLCCGEESAFYHLRRALDGGVELCAAHQMHARIWLALERPETAHAILRNRAVVLRDQPTTAGLEEYADLLLACNDVPAFLDVMHEVATREGEADSEVLAGAYLSVARHYARRGDERMYIGMLQRAARLRPNDDQLLLRLADAEWAVEEHGRAAELYRTVLRRTPAHPARSRLLQRLAEFAGEEGP